MLKFIKTNGVYLGFWILMAMLGLVGVYYAVFYAVVNAVRFLDK